MTYKVTRSQNVQDFFEECENSMPRTPLRMLRPLPFFCLHRGELGLRWRGGTKVMQQTLEHGPAVLSLPEMHAQPDEHIDHFPVAGLQGSFETAQGFILCVS